MAKKILHSIAICSFSFTGMVYFGGYLMSRWFRISVAKWGRECFRVSYGRPKFTLLVLGNLGLELWGPNSRGPIAALQRQGDDLCPGAGPNRHFADSLIGPPDK